MDDIVRQAMAKWPNVPDCYGWLGLDSRGHWYMRDDAAQAAGTFAGGVQGAKGSLLQHEKLVEFISRNYAQDVRGCWYFQNGPQRVFVELQETPWVWRVNTDFTVTSHTGKLCTTEFCLVDEIGQVYLKTDLGMGLIHTQDVIFAADAVEAGRWIIKTTKRSELPAEYGFVRNPELLQKK